jgi:hypothetical protein
VETPWGWKIVDRASQNRSRVAKGYGWIKTVDGWNNVYREGPLQQAGWSTSGGLEGSEADGHGNGGEIDEEDQQHEDVYAVEDVPWLLTIGTVLLFLFIIACSLACTKPSQS